MDSGEAFKTGSAVASTATAAALTVAADMGVNVAAEAATAVGIGAAIGNAIPIPFIGAAIGAIIGAFSALGAWITSIARDTYHPTMADAEAWLLLSRIHPYLPMSFIDQSGDADHGSKMMRYWMVVSGETPKGKKGNNGILHNPHLQLLENTFSCDNPYQCNDDPDEPMSSMVIMQDVLDRYHRWVASGGGKNLKAISTMIPTMHRDPNAARLILSTIRAYPQPFKNQMGLPEIADNLNQLQEQIRALRLIAGEDGPDPGKKLEKIFGGDLTVHKATKDPFLDLPFAMVYPYMFDKKSGKWVKISPSELKKEEQAAVADLTPDQRVRAGLAGVTAMIAGVPGQIDRHGNFVTNVATLTPEQRIGAGYVGKQVTMNGLGGHIDAQGAFIVDTKTASGPGEQDRTVGYMILGGVLTLTLGAFAALCRVDRADRSRANA
jgi:hypothetical protein